MPLKTGNTVAVERRVDLASLFCMIGRHGPAVALAVIAVVSVVAGLVIYRAVRRKRRKATAAADGDCDGGGPEGDESLIRESHGSVESTDVNDEGSSDVKEDVDLMPSDLRIRHRRAAAAEETRAPSSPPESDVRSPDIERVSSDGTEEAAVVCDSHQAGEANGSPQSDACTEAEMVSEDAVDRHRCESGDSIKDVLEEFHDSCLKEPEPINAANHEQGEEVSTAECQEDEGVTPEKDVFDETPRQEDSFQCASNDPVCFQQTSRMSENGDEAASSVESNSEEPVIHIEVSVPSVCCGKDEQFERDNTDGIGFSSYSGKARLAPEGESRNESEEAEEHPLDYLPIGEPAVISSTFQRESNLPPMQQEQRDHAKDEVAAPIRGSDRDEDGGLAGEEVVREDHFNKLTVAKLDATSAQLDEQGAEGVSGLTCDQEVGVLYDGAEQAKGKMPTSGNDVACSEERGGSSVVLSPAVTCLNAPVKADNHNVALSGTSSIADLSLACQPPQKEDNTAPSLDEDTNSPILGPQMPSPKTENLPDNNGNGTAVVLAEEHNDQQMIRKEAFDEESVAAVPDRAANVHSVLVDDISCPPLQSICQDQQIDPVEKNETSDETRIDSATDACNTTSCTALSMSEELSPDTQSSSQDQRSDQTTNNKEDFSEVTAAPVLTEDMNTPSCQIDLPSFEHFALRDNDISAPGVGEESGISSMAVSPDAVDECDVIFDEMVLQAVDCDLKPEGQTEAQNDPFADDVSVIEEDAACMVSCPEDMFGHEIEDGYYKMIDQLVAQIADGITCVTEKQSDMKFVVESEEKKKGGCFDMKEATKAEKEKEEDYEKTEISIMEATMDHNEWIMDSNYQAFPWMNLSVTSFAQDDTKNNQFPTEECQYSSAAADTRCTDTTDIPPSAEVLQAGTLSLLDEDIQNVQPMPQNVNVTFCVHYFTQTPYQTVAVTGNQRELGNWKGFVLLERAKDGHWATAVSLPAESHVEWKFVVVDKGEVCRWEECGNRLLDTASGDELLVHKCWARL